MLVEDAEFWRFPLLKPAALNSRLKSNVLASGEFRYIHSPPPLVLAEIELVRGFATEWVAEELLMTGGTQIVAKFLIRGSEFLIGRGFVIGENLADFVEVVCVQVILGQLGWIVRGEHFHFHDETGPCTRRHLFAAKVAREMHHI